MMRDEAVFVPLPRHLTVATFSRGHHVQNYQYIKSRADHIRNRS
jgi:hypothetical protein